MSGLVTFFKGRQDLDSGSDLLDQASDAFLKGEEIGGVLLFSMIEECKALPLESPEDCLDFYRLLISILFMREEENQRLDHQIEGLIRKGKTEGFWKSIQLEEGYRRLVDYLYEGKRQPFEVKQLEKGAVLQENEMHALERHIPHPKENAELALVCLYLGWVWQDDELVQSGLKLTEFCLSLCDHDGVLFQGMWVRESEYREKENTQTFSLLFTIASHVALSSKVQVVSEALFEKREGLQPFVALFAKAFQRLIEDEESFPKIHEGLTLYDHDQSLGFLRYHHESLSFACSASGVNTGLGVIHKKGIHITSFGPHYAPLADSNCYGIFRPSNGSRDGFKDLTIESGDEKARFKGWTRVVTPVASHVSKQPYSFAERGQQWLFFDVLGEKDRVNLTIRQSQFDETAPLHFVFFVSADKGMIEGKGEILPKALERFQGRSNKIIFSRGTEVVTITPNFEGEMEVIPLAGGDHFWSADFLLAFPLMEKMSAYRWNIE